MLGQLIAPGRPVALVLGGVDARRLGQRALVDKLRSLAEPPDEYTIEFGIKLTGKANVVVASAAAEANYRVTMTWRRT